MALMNLFSKPLDFKSTENGSENVTALREKSTFPGEFISKPLVIPQVQMRSNHLQRGAIHNNPIINDSSQNGCKKRRKQNKSLRKNKMPKYADYDGLMISSEEHSSSMNWPGSANNDVSVLNHDSFGRSVICYEDPASSPTKSKKQRSKELKAEKKNNNGNINKSNNIKNNIKTGNKKKGKNKKHHMKNTSQKGSGNVLSEAPPSYSFLGYSSSLLNTTGASCSIFGEQDGRSLKRKADDVDERKSKSMRVYDEWAPIFDDKKLAEPTEKTKMNNMKSKQPMTKSKLRKIEKSKQFWEKMKEKETRDTVHQQGLQRKIVPCKFYVNGCCNKGTECAFSHDIPQVKKDEPCKFYVMSQCTKEGCLYRHEWPCKFFHGQKGCRSNNCKFSHEPLTEITKKWLDKIFEEGESAIKSENGEKEDKVEEFKVECSRLEGTVDNFYGSAADQAFPEMTQPKQEAEIHCEALQPINMNKIRDVSTWGCSGDLKPSNNFDIIRIETPRKQCTSLFEFFKYKIESHRSNEFRDQCLSSPADAGESVIPSLFEPPISTQHSSIGLKASTKTNSDSLFSSSSTMILPGTNRHVSKKMMSLITTGNLSSPIIKPILTNSYKTSKSVKTSEVMSTPLSFSSTRTTLNGLKSNGITSSPLTSNIFSMNGQIPQNKGDSGLFSTPLSVDIESNYDKEKSKPLEKMRSLIKEVPTSFQKFTTKNKEFSTSTNMLGFFSTPLSFSFAELEVTCVKNKSKPKEMENSCVSDSLTCHPITNATLQTPSSAKVNGPFSTPFSFSSMKPGMPYSTTELESNKKAMSSKDNETSMINPEIDLYQHLSKKGHELFSTPLSFSFGKTDLNNGKIEMEPNGKVQKNEALNSIEPIIIANQESSTTSNILGLFSTPLSFSSMKTEITQGTDKKKSSKSVKDHLTCHSVINTTLQTSSSKKLNGFFSTPLSFSSMNADMSSSTNESYGKVQNDEALNDVEPITVNQELSTSANKLGLFASTLSFSTMKTKPKCITSKSSLTKMAASLVSQSLICHSIINVDSPIPMSLSSSSMTEMPCNSNELWSNKNRASVISQATTDQQLSSKAPRLFSTPLSFTPMKTLLTCDTKDLKPQDKLNSLIKGNMVPNTKQPINTKNKGTAELFSTPLSFLSMKTKPTCGIKDTLKPVKDHSICDFDLTPTSEKVIGLFSTPLLFPPAKAEILSGTNESESNEKEKPLQAMNHQLSAKAPGLFSTPLSFSSSKMNLNNDKNRLEFNEKEKPLQAMNHQLSVKAPGLFSTPLSFSSSKMNLNNDKNRLEFNEEGQENEALNNIEPIFMMKQEPSISTNKFGLFSTPLSFPTCKSELTYVTSKSKMANSLVSDPLTCHSTDVNLQVPSTSTVTGLFSIPLSFSSAKAEMSQPGSRNELKYNEKVIPFQDHETSTISQTIVSTNQQLPANTEAPGLFSTPLTFHLANPESNYVTRKLKSKDTTSLLVRDPLICQPIIDANLQTPTNAEAFGVSSVELKSKRNEMNLKYENEAPMTYEAVGNGNIQILPNERANGLFSTPLSFPSLNGDPNPETSEPRAVHRIIGLFLQDNSSQQKAIVARK